MSAIDAYNNSFVHNDPQRNSYVQRLECYRTGQMSERQLTEHLKDEHFAAWFRKQTGG